MSIEHVQMVKLHCDGLTCRGVYENIANRADGVRELAAADGWRHRKQPSGTSNWLRVVDLCPQCPDDVELKAPRNERRRR